MKQVQPEVGPPRGTEDPSVALVTEAEDLWWVATASGGQIEQSAGDLVTWDGSDAIGETLRFVFEQRIFVGDETTFSYTPTASNPFRSKRLKRAHALPPPNDEAGYGYRLTVGGDPAESPSEAADDEGEGREPDLRVRPRIRVRDVEILPIAHKDSTQTAPPPEEKGIVNKVNGNWVVKNSSQGHVTQNPQAPVRWPAHGSKKLHFMFDFDDALFVGKEKSFQVNLESGADDLVLQLGALPPGDYCYGIEVEENGTWKPVWGPAIDEM